MPLYLLLATYLVQTQYLGKSDGNNLPLEYTGYYREDADNGADQLILQELIPVVPPHVIYSLTRSGKK